jgi:hypothetical protein
VPPEKRTGAAEAQERQRRRAAAQQHAGPFGALFGAAAAAGHQQRAAAAGGRPQGQQQQQVPGLPASSERVGDLLLTHEKGEAEAVRRLADELLGAGDQREQAAASGGGGGGGGKAWITRPRAAPPCAPEREAAVACYSAALDAGGTAEAEATPTSRRLLACAPVVDAYARCAASAWERQQAGEERARGQRAAAAAAAAMASGSAPVKASA